MERWKDVNGFEFLEVSDYGRVRTKDSVRIGIRSGKPRPQRKKGTLMSPWVANNGYPTVSPKIGNTRRKLLVHRLVAGAFVPGGFEGATVNHIDGNKTNNHFSNLEWVTRRQNTVLQWRDGLVDLRGKNNKLSKEDVIAIRASALSARELAPAYRVSIETIYLIKKRRRWAWL